MTLINKYKLELVSKEINIRSFIYNKDDFYKFLKLINFDKEFQENLIAVFLNKNNEVDGYCEIGKGNIDGLEIDVRDIVKYCLITNCTRIALAHNHPDGTIKPSREDIIFTSNIKRYMNLINVELVDHLVIGRGDYRSC